MNRVFILGSCVSRDALEQAPGEYEVVTYLARTSLASVGLLPVDDAEVRDAVARLPSAFQRRMLVNDLDKTTLSAIAESAHDIVLLDFIDERFDLIVSGDSLFSLSGELKNTGFEPGERDVITPGSEEFLERWIAGLERFLAAVDPATIVLNKAYWADVFPDGSDASSPGWIRSNNAFLKQLYDALEARWALRTIAYPESIVLADPDHKWGRAPYHYALPFYEHTLQSLRELAARSG
ncbi:DUF6270 domain-containing protein [Stenotrophomonas humi]